MDPISDVLALLHVESVVYGRMEATAPWGFSVATGQCAKFGLVSQGSCWLSVAENGDPIQLNDGDFFLIAPGSAYSLSDSPTSAMESLEEILRARRGHSLRFGGGGESTILIGGKFSFDEGTSKPLTDLLPRLIHIRADQMPTPALETTVRLLATEMAASTPGSQLVVSRLADILFIQAIRAHLVTDSAVQSCWVGALGDQQIGAAIRSMHEAMEQTWTVAALAFVAGMSRSAFAQRFKELLGEGPMEYLTRWRMYKARKLLRDSDKRLVDVAKLVGYDSDGAFNKAFKRVIGSSPGAFRRNGTGSEIPVQ